jgi:hypothetical protein
MRADGWFFAVLLIGASSDAMAYEAPEYEVLHRYEDCEIRRYDPYVVAEVEVQASFEDAGGRAFRRLAAYIGGQNESQTSFAMTVPVEQRPATSAAMTEGERYVIAFIVPRRFDLSSAPVPTDPDIRIRREPAQTMAAIRYSGFWSKDNYRQHERTLREALERQGWEATGAPIFARYNAPFTPWFWRRNEILVPVRRP